MTLTVDPSHARLVLEGRPLEIFESLVGLRESEDFHDTDPKHEADLLAMWQALEVPPVVSRQGHLVFAMVVPGEHGDRVIHTRHVPDPATDFVEPEALTRTFQDCTSVDDLLEEISGHLAANPGSSVQVEDHPEEWSCGFLCPETNTVFLLHLDRLRDTASAATWIPGGTMLGNMGRVEVAKLLNAGRLHPGYAAEYMAKLKSMKMDPKTLKAMRTDAVARSMASRVMEKTRRKAGRA